MPRLNVGDRVVIDRTVAHYLVTFNNPDTDVRGTVIEAHGRYFCYRVRWDNDGENSYREGELRLVTDRQQTAVANIRNKPTTSQLIRQAKDKLKKYNDVGHNGVAIHIKGERLSILTGPCHGFIRNNGGSSSKAIVSLLKRSGGSPRGSQCSGDVVVRYCDWLFNRSPWSQCFMYKGAKNAWAEKSCVLRVDVPANLLQGALICTRNTWEYSRNINLWHELVTKHGVNEHIAFLATFFVSIDNGCVAPRGIHADHVAIGTNQMTEEGARAFLSNSPLMKQDNYNEGGNYQGVHEAFQGRGNHLLELLRKEFNSYGRESQTKNPFVKAKPRHTNQRTMTIPQYAMFATEFFGKYRA